MKPVKCTIVLVVIMLCSINLSAQQITPNWKTFESGKFFNNSVLSFKYPENWVADTCANPNFILKLNPKYVNNVSLFLKSAPSSNDYIDKELTEGLTDKFIKSRLKSTTTKYKIVETKSLKIGNQSYVVVDYQYEIKDDNDNVESNLARTYFFQYKNKLIYFKSVISNNGTLSETETGLTSIMASYSGYFESIIKSVTIN
ncbi:MAG: hypothetical protein Q8928_03210 [Bacteroidota bacterium]|nr:hypothetical protein [Bacteroidota bacterium]